MCDKIHMDVCERWLSAACFVDCQPFVDSFAVYLFMYGWVMAVLIRIGRLFHCILAVKIESVKPYRIKI